MDRTCGQVSYCSDTYSVSQLHDSSLRTHLVYRLTTTVCFKPYWVSSSVSIYIVTQQDKFLMRENLHGNKLFQINFCSFTSVKNYNYHEIFHATATK